MATHVYEARVTHTSTHARADTRATRDRSAGKKRPSLIDVCPGSLGHIAAVDVTALKIRRHANGPLDAGSRVTELHGQGDLPVPQPPVHAPAVSKLCLTLETFRRTDEGRIRTAKDFQEAFFPYDANGCEDRVFFHLPNSVRAKVITAWGLRGSKTALRDSDEKVKSVVHDALSAGDLDAQAFEDGLDPAMVTRYLPLVHWWTFLRSANVTKVVVGKVLTTAYEVELFDAKWFWETIKSGTLAGTDALAEYLSKSELTEWLRTVHGNANGTPTGLLLSIGWERILNRTPNDVLLPVVDALAAKIGLSGVSGVMTDTSGKGGTSGETPSVSAMVDVLLGSSKDVPSPPSSVEAVLLEEYEEDTIPPQPIDEVLAGRLKASIVAER